MEDISPKDIQNIRCDEEATYAHPETVCKGGQCERDDEVGKQRGDQDHKRFSGEEVEKKPHYPGKERGGRGLEVGEPVSYSREEKGHEDCGRT